MIELKPGIAGVLARTWRMRVIAPPTGDVSVVLEMSPDEGMTWLGPMAICPITPGASVAWALTGPLQDPPPGT